jgi:hypothetical protein
MSQNHVEPQRGAESFSCPHCGAFAHQDWYRLFISRVDNNNPLARVDYLNVAFDVVEKIEDEDERNRVMQFLERLEENDVTYKTRKFPVSSTAEMVNLFLSHCYSCKGFAIWVEDELMYPVVNTEIRPHEELPASIRRDFEEAASIVNLSPRGAAALLRLCIQQLMPILGEKGNNLNDDIASLVMKGLEPEIQQALDLVRVIGNNAVHPGEIDLRDDKATAVRLFELVNLVVERRIATPNRIKALFQGLPPRAIDSIEKRDAPESQGPIRSDKGQ